MPDSVILISIIVLVVSSNALGNRGHVFLSTFFVMGALILAAILGVNMATRWH